METSRTVLSKPTAMDYDEVFALQSNQQTRQYLGGPVTKEEFPEKFKDILDAKVPESYWVVRQKETNAFIGFVSIAKYHDQIHYEVSYELDPEFWGDGYGAEIIEKVISYGFKDLSLEEIYAETQKKNAASIRLLEKVGMQLKSEVERFGEQQVVYAVKTLSRARGI